MTTTKLRCLEDKNADRKKKYTRRTWLDRFEHYMETVHGLDTTNISGGKNRKNVDRDRRKDTKQNILWAISRKKNAKKYRIRIRRGPARIKTDKSEKKYFRYNLPKRKRNNSRRDFCWFKKVERKMHAKHWESLREVK